MRLTTWVIILISLLLSCNAMADGKGDLVDDCYNAGHYSLAGAAKVKANKDFTIDGNFESLRDFCHKTFELLYPVEYKETIKRKSNYASKNEG